MLRPDPSNVYLCYSSKDQHLAHRIAESLQTQDIPLWWDPALIPVGVNWNDFLLDLAECSVCTLILWSQNSIQDAWVHKAAEIAQRRRALVPILLESVPVPDQFANIQACDLRSWTGGVDDPSFRRLVDAVRAFITTAPSSADMTRVYKQSQRSAELRAADLFQRNARSEITLDYVELKKTGFYEEINWNLCSGINVLLGRNGYGKSYLLKTLVALLQYDDSAALGMVGEGAGLVTLLRDGSDAEIHFSDSYFNEDSAVGKVPVLAIPDMRFTNRSVTTLSPVSDESVGPGDRADLAGYGAWHFLQDRPYESMIQSFLYGLCLDYFENGLQFKTEQFDLIQSVVRELTDRSFAFDRVTREGRERFTLYAKTEGNESNPLPIQKASQGTLSIIAIFGLIYDYLRSLRPANPRPVCERRGIVIIDEADAHLHPVWQQKLVALLRSRFPQTQFIITAHNPIIVAGCLEDEVSVLRKTPSREFVLYQFPNDFVGWQMDEINRKVFEIENPDDNFALFDAMRPFKPQLEQQAEKLQQKSARTQDEERSLEDIEKKLLYIGKAEDARIKRLNQADLERENRGLRERLDSSTAARELSRLKDELAASEKKAKRASIYLIALSVCVTLLVILFFLFARRT